MLFNIIQGDELVLEWIITIVINLPPGNYQTIVKQELPHYIQTSGLTNINLAVCQSWIWTDYAKHHYTTNYIL